MLASLSIIRKKAMSITSNAFLDLYSSPVPPRSSLSMKRMIPIDTIQSKNGNIHQNAYLSSTLRSRTSVIPSLLLNNTRNTRSMRHRSSTSKTPPSESSPIPTTHNNTQHTPLHTLDITNTSPSWWKDPPKLWIVFSDLHVTARTLPICMNVLQQVRQEAYKRSAGIAFLGDFWHQRGSLPVEPLNTLLRLFGRADAKSDVVEKWDIPTVMLVGNHDQVSLGGLIHGLTPLSAASPEYICVFERPTVFANALWLPYRRDSREIVDALGSIEMYTGDAVIHPSYGGSGSGNITTTTNNNNGAVNSIDAIFAHADVKGASMNDAYQARDGLPPSIFPQNIPVYCGHYHKPHLVPGTKIRYVGSPYQVSRSEAGQQKALLVLDRTQNWKSIEEIPLDIGPRNFTAATSNDLRSLLSPTSLFPLRKEDRIRITIPRDDLKREKKALTKLSSLGIALQIMPPPPPSAQTRIHQAEDLGPLELFQRYGEMHNLPSGAIERGIQLLLNQSLGNAASMEACFDESTGTASLPGHTSTTSSSSSPTIRSKKAGAYHPGSGPVSLSFHCLEVEGYFSFKDTQRYSLENRGFVVVTGQIDHETATSTASMRTSPAAPPTTRESNGAGKTALVMAPLWAITGTMDSRSDSKQSSTAAASSSSSFSSRILANADIINDECKMARVRVEGRVNNIPFVIERKVVRRGKGGGLTFQLDGKDLTAQEIRLTQAAIDDALATSLLGRAVFYGQSDITALLDSSDKAFKAELGKIVDLDVWEIAKEASRKELSRLRGEMNEAIRDRETRKGYAIQFEEEVKRNKEMLEQQVAEFEQRLCRVESDADNAREQLIDSIRSSLRVLDKFLHATTMENTNEFEHGADDDDANILLRTLHSIMAKNKANITANNTNNTDIRIGAREQQESREQEEEEENMLAQAQMHAGALHATASTKQRALEEYQHLFDHGHTAVCDRCYQTIDSEQHRHQLQRMKEEYDHAVKEAQRAREQMDSLQRKKANALREKNAKIELQRAVEAMVSLVNDACVSILPRTTHTNDHGEVPIINALEALLISHGTSSSGEKKEREEPVNNEPTPDSSLLNSLFSQLDHALGKYRHITYQYDQLLDQANNKSLAVASPESTSESSSRLQEWLLRERTAIEELETKISELEVDIEHLKVVDDAFKGTGIVSFVLEGALGDLQEASSRHLSHLAPNLILELSATRARKTGEAGVIEQIEKRVFIRPSSPSIFDGENAINQDDENDDIDDDAFGEQQLIPRSINGLSGGERRRVALALALGFSEVAARRGRLRSDLLVLDEVMQHLDGDGCARVVDSIRGLFQQQNGDVSGGDGGRHNVGYKTVLLVAQAGSFATRAVDEVDVVVKNGDGRGGSSVIAGDV